MLLEGDPEELKITASMLESAEDGTPVSFGKIIPADGADADERNRLWGTPEDAEETDVISFRGGAALEYTFDTVKTCPAPVFRRLAEMHPGLGMTVRYAYEDYGNDCGTYRSEPGSGELVFLEPEDPFVFACEVWDVDPDEEMAELEINYAEE